MNFLRKVFFGPQNQKDHLTVTFHLLGGQSVTTHHVQLVETTKTPQGGFASYSIVWHDGYKPSFFSLSLDHISAIEAHKMG